MLRLAANLSTLFCERPFLERFEAAAAAGFDQVEYQFPYRHGAAREIAACASAAGVQVVLHNIDTGDEARGDRGLGCLPDRIEQFRTGVEQAIDYALAAGCPRLNCLAGVAPPGVPRALLLDTLAENVAFAADRCRAVGLTLLIEPVNTRSVPGFLLSSSAQALQVIETVRRSNVQLQYDLFHMQIQEGDLAMTIERCLPRIGHMQLADVPGRHEPGTGEINFAWLLPHIDRLGYHGSIGCEYLPLSDTWQSLGWAQAYLRAPR